MTSYNSSSQSRLESAAESGCNVLIGYVVALVAQLCIFPLFGINISVIDHMGIGVLFTLVSMVRSYIIRRWFNKRRNRQ